MCRIIYSLSWLLMHHPPHPLQCASHGHVASSLSSSRNPTWLPSSLERGHVVLTAPAYLSPPPPCPVRRRSTYISYTFSKARFPR